MRCAPASISSSTTMRSRIRARIAAATRSRRWRTSCPASTTTPASRRLRRQPSRRRPIRTSASTSRTSGRSRRAVTFNAGRPLRPAVPGDDQHRHEQRVAAPRRSPGRPRLAPHRRARQRRPVLRSRPAARARQRAAVGRQHHRRSTRCARYVVSLSPTQAGAPVFPDILPAAVPLGDAAEPDDDGSRPAECVFAAGQRRDRAAARRSHRRSASATNIVNGSNLLMSINQNVPTLRGIRHQQRLPADPDLREQQPVLVGRRLELSRRCMSR